MKNRYVLKTFLILFFAVILVYSGFITASFLQNNKKTFKEYVQSAAFIKSDLKKGFCRVELYIYDNIHSKEGEILEVTLNDYKISLNPTDPQGYRGSSHFQLKPGLYILKWTIKKHKKIWPRQLKYRKKILITEHQQWLHIYIEGKKVTIE